MIKYLVQDIETVPESEIVDMWDSEKEVANSRYPGREPFPPVWCHKVISIGMLALDEDLKPKKGGCAAGGLAGGKSEKEMIERWSAAASGIIWRQKQALHLVDYNGRGFDIPVLQTRAFRYGIQLPWYFGKLPDNKGEISSFSKQYRHRYGGWHLDIQELWTNHNAFRYPHLANLARLMGLPGKLGIDGPQVHDAFKEEKFQEIDIYCMQDVFQTAFIFQRFSLVMGDIDLKVYRAAATELLSFIADATGQEEFAASIDKAALLLE